MSLAGSARHGRVALPLRPRRWRVGADGWIDALQRIESPNHDARPSGMAIELLVVHSISLPPGVFGGDAVAALFTNRLDAAAHPSFADLGQLRVSAHFLVRRSGSTVQFVSCERRAWHAGASNFRGRPRCNDFSIGVELEGDAIHPFTAAQYRQLARLARTLARRYPLRWVAGHADVAPGRKVDPGPSFDWPRALGDLVQTGIIRPYPRPDAGTAA